MDANKILEIVKNNPRLSAMLLGGTAGGLIGGARSEEGAQLQGALYGAGLGGLAGGAAGSAAGTAKDVVDLLTPTKTTTMLTSGLAAGGLAGMYGKSRISPWARARALGEAGVDPSAVGDVVRKEESVDTGKEASMSTVAQVKEAIEKQAELEKEAALRMTAFDAGIDLALGEKKVSKEALAKLAFDCSADELAFASLEWTEKSAVEAEKQAAEQKKATDNPSSIHAAAPAGGGLMDRLKGGAKAIGGHVMANKGAYGAGAGGLAAGIGIGAAARGGKDSDEKK